jgi:hypothetical protein
MNTPLRSAPLALLPLLTLLFAAGPAAASERGKFSHEASFTMASQRVLGEPFPDILADDRGAMSPMGFRLGVGISGPISAIGGYQNDLQSTTIDVPDTDVDIVHQLRLHQVLAGVKVQQPIRPWIAPYATLQLSAVRGVMRLDEDLNRDDNLNQLTSKGNALGGVAAIGIDLRPLQAGPVRLGTHLEVGYGLHSRLQLEAGDEAQPVQNAAGDPALQGELQLRGLAVHWGVGLRF